MSDTNVQRLLRECERMQVDLRDLGLKVFDLANRVQEPLRGLQVFRATRQNRMPVSALSDQNEEMVEELGVQAIWHRVIRARVCETCYGIGARGPFNDPCETCGRRGHVALA